MPYIITYSGDAVGKQNVGACRTLKDVSKEFDRLEKAFKSVYSVSEMERTDLMLMLKSGKREAIYQAKKVEGSAWGI